jgi:hypothetical protein
MFYYGYIASVLPMALFLARVNIKYAAGTVVVLWGVTALLTVVCRDCECSDPSVGIWRALS